MLLALLICLLSSAFSFAHNCIYHRNRQIDVETVRLYNAASLTSKIQFLTILEEKLPEMNTHQLQILGLRIAGTIFGLVALLHIIRIITQVPISIGACSIPVWLNILGFFATGALSALLWIVSSKEG